MKTFKNGIRLSIVVNNYNYSRFLPEALDSALQQMGEEDELIVVDDGSTDGSMEILRRYQSEYSIRVIEQQNSGQMRAVRVGIQAAQGDVVALLDSDDYFLDGYLARLRQLYAQNPEVSFIFANARLGGNAEAGAQGMREILDAMELPPGSVGKTRWAALLFYEFVGTPTSGISLLTPLAREIATLPETLDETVPIPPLFARLMGISKIEMTKSGFSADGVIVRSASILQAIKYYDERPGFMYRIHGSNKYASSSRRGRWYLRRLRKKQFAEIVSRHFGLARPPTAAQLREEILGRSLGLRLRRRIRIRAHYCREILRSTGVPQEKFKALAVAFGIAPGK